MRGYMATAYENVALWHERDISHSSAERIIIPDATILLDYMLNRLAGIIANLTVYPENMLKNMEKSLGLIYSQRILLALIDKGLSREEAYGLVQPRAMEAWAQQIPFRDLLLQDPAITYQVNAWGDRCLF
jgi:adenylosuccinate lyase